MKSLILIVINIKFNVFVDRTFDYPEIFLFVMIFYT